MYAHCKSFLMHVPNACSLGKNLGKGECFPIRVPQSQSLRNRMYLSRHLLFRERKPSTVLSSRDR
jgi:hypothetical protein